jgi:hypothetical protein
MLKPGDRVTIMNRTPSGKLIQEGEAVLFETNGPVVDGFQTCEVRFEEDVKRDGLNCPVYIRRVDLRVVSYLPLRPGGVMRCCEETLRTVPVMEEEGTVLPCLHCSTSLVLRDGKWEWNQEGDER